MDHVPHDAAIRNISIITIIRLCWTSYHHIWLSLNNYYNLSKIFQIQSLLKAHKSAYI
jgi:hypothetical protein